MKKNVCFVFLLAFLFLPVVSAIQFEMKSNFSQGETLFAKISGNFYQPISSGDVVFYSGGDRIPNFQPSVQEINKDFYISAQLFGQSPGNYSMKIQNAKYYRGAQIVTQDISKDFAITSNQSDFSIDPAFVLSSGDFSVSVTNLRDNEITVSSKITNSSSAPSSSSSGGFFDFIFGGGSSASFGESSTAVKSGETKKIFFSAQDFSPISLQSVELSANNTLYDIPVFINSNQANGTQNNLSKIQFDQSSFGVSMPTNSNTSRISYLYNLGNFSIDNVQILFSDSLKPYMKVSEENFSIGANSSRKLQFDFSSGNSEISAEGQIRAKTQDNVYSYISVFLNFTRSYQPGQNPGGGVSAPLCSALNGTVCPLDQTCSGDSKIASDGICCIGTCSTSQSGGSSAWTIVGWGIVIVIVLLVALFYFMRYKKITRVVDLLKVAKEQ